MRAGRVALTATAVLLAAGVAACGQVGETEAQSGPSPSPVPSEAVEPAGEPSPESAETVEPSGPGHPAIEDLIITTAGLGPLTVGLPPTTNPGAAMIEFDPDYCAAKPELPPPGRWVPTGGYAEPNDTDSMGEPTLPFWVEASDDWGVTAIRIWGVGPHTAQGIRVGSALVELQAAYPELEGPYADESGDVSPGEPAWHTWWVADDTGSIVFETQDDAGGLLPPGTEESVVLIHVLDPRIGTAITTANGGLRAGDCTF